MWTYSCGTDIDMWITCEIVNVFAFSHNFLFTYNSRNALADVITGVKVDIKNETITRGLTVKLVLLLSLIGKSSKRLHFRSFSSSEVMFYLTKKICYGVDSWISTTMHMNEFLRRMQYL